MPIYKRASKKSKNGYKYQVNFQYTDKYGVKKRYIKNRFDTKKEALLHESMKKQEFENGIYITKSKSFDDVFNEYIQSADVRKRTLCSRKQLYSKIIKKQLGHIDITKIDYDLIQDLLNNCGKTYSHNTCKAVKSIINIVFVYAYNLSYIKRIPYSRLKISGKKGTKNNTITIAQFNTLIESLSHPTLNQKIRYDSYIIMLYIGLYTGMRIAEVLALTREDVDLKNKTITVKKQLHDEIENYTKTESSTAVIPIPNELVDILTEHFHKYPETDLVCFNNDMNYLSYKSAVDKCYKLGKKNGFDFHFHMLRHTFVTQVIRKKIDIKTAQMLARHSNINTTMDIYTNLDDNDLIGVTDNLYN